MSRAWNGGALAFPTRRCTPIPWGACEEAPAGLGWSPRVSATSSVMLLPLLPPPAPRPQAALSSSRTEVGAL